LSKLRGADHSEVRFIVGRSNGKIGAMFVSVKMCNISKRFSGVIANKDVSVDAQSGDVHAILGENGAGKTTLMKVLAGLHAPDSGHIDLDGTHRVFRNPRSAIEAGIGMVHQHFALIPAMTVEENLALGNGSGSFVFKPKQWREELRKSAEEIGLNIRLSVPVWQLSLGERQKVEIFRLIKEGARVLILDEPTSILAPSEAESLFDHIRQFARTGHAVFLVTHKISHVLAVASKITILRRGKVVSTGNVTEFTASQLSELMVGEQAKFMGNGISANEGMQRSFVQGKSALSVSDLTVPSIYCSQGLRLENLELKPGEILGVAGIGGNGQDELVAAIGGLTRYKGTIEFAVSTGKAQINRELGFIPADRVNVGVAASLSLRDNLTLRKYEEKEFRFGPFLRFRKLATYAQDRIRQFNITPDNPSGEARLLSGGNIQKAVLARELDGKPSVILAANPTAGLDIATVEFVHNELKRQAQEGAGIILASEDLDELLEICDRLIVLYEGKCVGSFETSTADKHEIGLLMSHGPASVDTRPLEM
jgi:ABC-type uncharacterized transport system ATPase subunit